MPYPDWRMLGGRVPRCRSIETHGLDVGPYEYEYVICRGCCGRFDVAEWSAAPGETERGHRLRHGGQCSR